MNIFDIITIIVAIWALIAGWRKGLVEQLLTLAGIVIAIIVALRMGYTVGSWLSVQPSLRGIVGFIITFLVVILVAFVGAKLLSGMLKFVGLDSLNTTLGILFAELKMLLILSIIYTALYRVNPEWKIIEPQTIESSYTFRPVRMMTDFIMPYIDKIKQNV